MRIAASQKERWSIKAAEWNPELSSKYRTNEFLKQIEDETENLTESINHIK